MENPGFESQAVARKFSPKRPDRPCGPSSLLLNGLRVDFSVLRRRGREVDHSHPSSAFMAWRGTS
jgi:hypothetical protein